MSAKIRDRHWNILLDSIKGQNCIPVLGPDLCITNDDGTRSNLAVDLARKLADILLEEDERLTVKDPNNLSLVAQMLENELSRSELIIEVKGFYEGHAKNLAERKYTTFENLAALPFPLFVTSRHDNTLEHYLMKQGKQPKVANFHFKGKQTTTLRDLGTVEEPLIYHLYGSLKEAASLVITENDLLDFLKAVVANEPGLPVDLQNLFCDKCNKRDKNVLFLGFGLGNYHLRILLHALNLSKRNMSFALENTPVDERQEVFTRRFNESVLFYGQLGFNALKMLDTRFEEFIDELHRRWVERYPEGTAATALEPPRHESIAVAGPKIFISYVEEDEERAQRLFERLREEGLDPWIDKAGLRSGAQWADTLTDKISKEVDYFVLLQSRALSDRRESYVYMEVDIALERQKRRPGPFIFPVQIDKDAQRLDAVERANIQTGPLYDWNADVKTLAADIRRDYDAHVQKMGRG
jgi:hypothetical protein